MGGGKNEAQKAIAAEKSVSLQRFSGLSIFKPCLVYISAAVIVIAEAARLSRRTKRAATMVTRVIKRLSLANEHSGRLYSVNLCKRADYGSRFELSGPTARLSFLARFERPDLRNAREKVSRTVRWGWTRG